MKRGAVIGIVAAATAVVVAGGVAGLVLTRPTSADAVADEYLRALSEGDFPAIESLVVDGGEDLEQVEAAFAGASAYISDYSFEIDDGGAGTQRVRAEVDLDGEPAVVLFVLTQEDGRWRVAADHLGSLEVETTIGDSVRVGDALVPAATPISVLPAAYPVTAAPGGLVVGDTSAIVTNEAPVTVTVDAALAPEATTAAQEQLDAYADACARPADAVSENCGLRVPWAADLASLSSIAFRIDAYPVLALADDGRSFAATDGEVVATATGTTRAGTPGTFTYRADDWALRGAVAFVGDEMVLAVR